MGKITGHPRVIEGEVCGRVTLKIKCLPVLKKILPLNKAFLLGSVASFRLCNVC